MVIKTEGTFPVSGQQIGSDILILYMIPVF